MEFNQMLEEKVGHINDILLLYTPDEDGRFKKYARPLATVLKRAESV